MQKQNNNNNNNTQPAVRRTEQFTNLPAVKEPMELLDFLIAKGSMSRNKAKTLLTHRAILVDKNITTQYNFELRPGMMVQISKSHNLKVFKSQHVKLVYEDAYLIVVDKRAGIAAVGNEKQKDSTVFSILSEYVKRTNKQRRVYGVHRLDREASGLMIFAKDERTKQNLQERWEQLITERAYVAVLEGDIENDNGCVSSWIVDGKVYVAQTATNHYGDKAVTYYTTIKRANGYSLVELDLGNGHKEQIRSHMQELNHPIVGDPRSGLDNNPIGRLAMHAFLIRFRHPVTGELLNFETAYPMEFRKLLKKNT